MIANFTDRNTTLMSRTSALKESTIQIIYILYILLFVYAAASKIIDMENFQVQLGQSPLLSAYADWMAWGVPALELLLSLLFLFDSLCLPALVLSTALMLSFSTYIVIILNWTPYVPCSCGGILEKLGWTEHLYFNLFMVALGFFGMYLQFQTRHQRGDTSLSLPRFISLLITVLVTAPLFVFYLYKSSDYTLHNDNSFIRAFIEQPQEVSKTDLLLNSYYFAGARADKLYLGNYTAPLAVKIVDYDGGSLKSLTITADVYPHDLGRAQLRVLDNQFHLIAANTGRVYLGSTDDWRIRREVLLESPILKYDLIDRNTIAATFLSDNNAESVLGKFSLQDGKKTGDNPSFLKRQVDGVFDVDGSIAYNRESGVLVYTYYYRNRYMVAGCDLRQKWEGKTIDTNAIAKIRIAEVSSRGEKKLASPPLSVNKHFSVYRNLLFVQSELPGRHEPLDMWEVARVIDVYDYVRGTYISSFYIYNRGKEKLSNFFVVNSDLYAFVGTDLVRYRLGKYIMSHYH